MPYLEWTHDYSVNVREIDAQHKQLVNMINSLYDALVAKKGRELQGKIINEMVAYAQIHFATEEKYMQHFKFSGHLAHKAEHESFKVKAADLKRRSDEKGFILTIEILNFLKEWLQNHILGTDRKYTAHFNSCGLN